MLTWLRTAWTQILDTQHRAPVGLLGALIGARMARQHAPETAWTLDLLDLQATNRCLELGFGAGRALEAALQRVPQGRVIGVDVSVTMLRTVARRLRDDHQAGRLRLVRGDLTALPLRGRFDRIWSIHTFYFWPDHERTLNDLYDLLAPNGTLVITLATARLGATGEYEYWPIHRQVETLVQQLREHGWNTSLQRGPRNRQYNNVALVVRRAKS